MSSFAWNQGNLHELLTGRDGPVFRDMISRAVRVEGSAKQHATGRPGPNVITGRLRGSITYVPGADATSPYVDVGSNVEYAPYVEARYPYLRPALEAARST